jgi:hypothetical protein
MVLKCFKMEQGASLSVKQISKKMDLKKKLNYRIVSSILQNLSDFEFPDFKKKNMLFF